jgi:hypothetical protein
MIKKIFLVLFLFNVPISGMEVGAHTYSKKYKNIKQGRKTDSFDDERDNIYNEGLEEPLFAKILADEKKTNKNKKISPPSSEMIQRRITTALLNKDPIDFEEWKRKDIAHRIYDKKAIEAMVGTFLIRNNKEIRQQNIETARKLAKSYWKERKKGESTPTHEESLESLKCLKFALEVQQKIIQRSLNGDECYSNPELNELIFVKCMIIALIRFKSQVLVKK